MIWDFLLRLLVASILGGIIGLDREYRAKEAGVRTHFLVALGSALIMIVSQYGFSDFTGHFDPGRIAAQVVTGIGFIGAGAIMVQRQFVRGLSTAAGVWATAGIGLAVGAGMYGLGIGAMLLTLAGLELFTFMFKSLGLHTSNIVFSTTEQDNLQKILTEIHHKNYVLVSYQVQHETVGANGEWFRVTMIIKTRKYVDENHLTQFIQTLPNLTIELLE